MYILCTLNRLAYIQALYLQLHKQLFFVEPTYTCIHACTTPGVLSYPFFIFLPSSCDRLDESTLDFNFFDAMNEWMNGHINRQSLGREETNTYLDPITCQDV